MPDYPRYQYYHQAIQGRPLPLAYIDLDLLADNTRQILQRAQGKPVRIVSKSIRSVDLLRRILASSDQFHGIMCYHPAEAAFLSQQGFDDLLVAYPSLQAAAIHKVCQETQQDKRIYLMVDSLPQLELIAQIAQKLNIKQAVCLDLDLSLRLPGLYFGVRRSPIRSVKHALDLYQQLKKCPHVELKGVMGYEAQIAGIGDAIPGKYLQNLVLPSLKKIALPILSKRRRAVVEALIAAGADLDFVNGGGTGSIDSTAHDTSVTEIAVGSGFYAPHLFDCYHSFHYQAAAGFALEVVRVPSTGYVTCSGGGYLASGAVGPEKAPMPFLPEGLSLDVQEGAGEVQTPLKYKGMQLAEGDPVFFRHAKAGELCERFNELLLIQNGKVIDACLTYRGQGQVFM